MAVIRSVTVKQKEMKGNNSLASSLTWQLHGWKQYVHSSKQYVHGSRLARSHRRLVGICLGIGVCLVRCDWLLQSTVTHCHGLARTGCACLGVARTLGFLLKSKGNKWA